MKRFAYLLFLPLITNYAFAATPVADDNDSKIKLPVKTAEEKFLYVSNVGVDFKKNDGIDYLNMLFNRNDKDKNITVEAKIEEVEAANKKIKDRQQEYKDKAEARKSSNSKGHLDKEDDNVKEEYTSLGNDFYQALKKNGYIDTVNQVFQDENNTLVLEGKISHINVFMVTGLKDNPCCTNCYKAKVYLKWYVKNRYGEILDSTLTYGISDNYFREDNSYGFSSLTTARLEKMVGNGVTASFVNLYKAEAYKKRSKAEPVPASLDPVLQLNKPKALVADKADASSAAVIIKRDDQGHGSGFAITQDGYILTNYHVIATTDPTKLAKIKVLLSGGDEVEAKIVRYNKARDIALLKVEKTFEKAFAISKEKKFQNLEDVYTIGAPKSIELGQTMTTGLISNERNTNNNSLLQLSMPVNFGNSGGPLFNKAGTLHGVIVAKLVGSSTEGISFAIPAYKIGDYLNITY